MPVLITRDSGDVALDASSEVSRSVHADAVSMARRDLGRGLGAMAACLLVGWLAPPAVSLTLLPLPALAALAWTIQSVARLSSLRRADSATWFGVEQRDAVRERTEIAAYQARGRALPVATLALAAVVIAVTVIEWSVGTRRAIDVAALVKAAVREGEWWRLVSASFLHVSGSHLAGNMCSLVVLGQFVEMYDGRLRVVLVYFLSVLGCSLASLLLTPATSLGASGGVIGLAGYLAVVAGRGQSYAPRFVRRQMAVMLLATVATGITGFLFIDNAGHAGGVAAGALVGVVILAIGHRPAGIRVTAAVSRTAAAVLIVSAVFTGVQLLAHRAPPVRGLDHVPVAVNDLESAAVRFRALGFTLKPGRPHDNGIINQHAKFADLTELELITAPEARDDLTRTYREHLAKGDGPAFLALFTPERTTEVERVARELPPYIFFGPRNASPTDRPEYFQHANTAESLVAVWLAGADFSRERMLFQRLGATLTEEVRDLPRATRVTVAKFAEGEVLMMPADRQVVAGRRVVGASVRVRSLDFILNLHLAGTTVLTKRGRVLSAFVPPPLASGLWLEFWAGPVHYNESK